MDRTKPDTSTQDAVQHVSSSMNISESTPSMVDVSPSTSKLSKDFVASGSSNCSPAVAPDTTLDNMDTSGTTPRKNQELSSSIGSNEDSETLLKLLLLNPNMGESMSDLLATPLPGVCFYGF